MHPGGHLCKADNLPFHNIVCALTPTWPHLGPWTAELRLLTVAGARPSGTPTWAAVRSPPIKPSLCLRDKITATPARKLRLLTPPRTPGFGSDTPQPRGITPTMGMGTEVWG